MKQNKSRVTLKQVAEHAGVSRATASLIVRNSPSISQPTRDKVLKSMKELGYVYDRVAASLREQTSTTVGLIITDIANPFYSDLLIGVHQALEKEGYTVLLGTTFDSIEKQKKLLSTMMENRVGGVILCPVSKASIENVEDAARWNLPLVLAVREIEGIKKDYVGINYEEGAFLAVNHLINEGHRRIGFLGGDAESSAWKERRQGYERAFKQAGIEVEDKYIVESSAERAGGIEAVRHLEAHGIIPEALFCFNDLVAFGVMQELRQLGYVPGEDVAVVGFDNAQEASVLSYPSLSTVSSHAEQIGSFSAKLLHERIKDPARAEERVILQPDLVVRQSSLTNKQNKTDGA